MSMRVWILGIFVLIAVMMYMPQVNAQNNNSVNEQNKDESYFFLSPLKQIQNGVLPEFVQCNENLDLMFKISDNSPVCLTWDTRDELLFCAFTCGIYIITAINTKIPNIQTLIDIVYISKCIYLLICCVIYLENNSSFFS